MASRIAILLPLRERITRSFSGAIGISVREFTLHSRNRASTQIFGANATDFPDILYHQIEDWKLWYRRNRTAYAQKFVQLAREHSLLEIHNRPTIAAYVRKQLPHRRVTLFFHNDPLTMEGAVTTADRLKLAAQLDAIYCVSQFVREQFMQGLSSDIDNIHTVHCGADLSCYPVAEKREKIIFFAGRIVAEKGILELLEAFSRVRDLIPDWRLAIAGEDKGGMLWRRLSPGCLNLGRLSHSETLQWFSRAEISVVPTVSAEPFGRVAMEAMGCGSALITSGSGGLKEIVGDEAVVVGRPDPAVLANAIVALANDPDRRRRLQVLGKSRIARMFDINRIVEKFDDVRDQLLTGDEPVLSQPRTVRPFSRPAAVGR